MLSFVGWEAVGMSLLFFTRHLSSGTVSFYCGTILLADMLPACEIIISILVSTMKK